MFSIFSPHLTTLLKENLDMNALLKCFESTTAPMLKYGVTKSALKRSIFMNPFTVSSMIINVVLWGAMEAEPLRRGVGSTTE